MFSSIKWTIFNLLIYIILVHGEIANIKICANEECTEPISHAKTLIKYVSNKRGVMSFGLNEDVVVYNKYKGEKNDLWTVEINGRKGDVPKRFLREQKIVAKKVIELPLTTSDELPSLTSKGEETPSVNEIEKQNDAPTEKHPAEVEINSKDESRSEDNLVKELSPSRVLKQTSVELDPSITLDNVVEYTGQKVNLASEPIVSSAWFPETPKVAETNLDDISRSSELNDDSNLLSSLTVEESSHTKYLVIDGTSIIDEEPESSVPIQDQLKSKHVEDFDYQLTSTQIESSIGQIFSSAVEYFPSASSSSLFESSTVSNLNTRSDEILTEKESENGQDKSKDENKEENNSGGWFNGISEFFSVDEVENTEIKSDAASAVPDELGLGATESTKIVEESNLSSIKKSESEKSVDAQNEISVEQNKISDDGLTKVDDKNKEDVENKEDDESGDGDEGYTSRSLLSKEEELNDDEDDDSSNDVMGNETEEHYLENAVDHLDLQSDNASDAVNLDEQMENLPSLVPETSKTSDSTLKSFETKADAEVNEKLEKEEQLDIGIKSLPEAVMGNKEENILLNDNNSEEKEEINNTSSAKSIEVDTFVAKKLEEEKVDDDRTWMKPSEEKVDDDVASAKSLEMKIEDDVTLAKSSEIKIEDDVASVKFSEEEKSENEIASNKSLDEKIENDSASNKSLDEKIENDSASNTSLDEKIESDLLKEEILKGIDTNDETVNDDKDGHENKIELADKFDEQNVEEAVASKLFPISDDHNEFDPLTFEENSSNSTEYNLDHETSEFKNSNEETESLNSDYTYSDNQQHSFTESNLDNCDVNEDGYCTRKVVNDVPDDEGYFESEIEEEDAQYSLSDQFKYFLDMILKWLPDPILEYLHELEVLGVSPKVVTLTVIVGIFVLILEISYLALKKRFKEKSYLTKLGSLDQKLFSAITERDELKQELIALKQMTENSYEEFSDSQKIIDEIQQELDYSRNICEKLQADNATLQEQLNTATDVGTDLNQMLSEFLTSQTSNVKLQDAVTNLQDQLESQQNIINSLQLQEETTKEINLRNKEQLEALKLEKVTLEALIEELTTSQKDLLLEKDNLTVENDTKTQQIDYLQQNNAQLLKESEEWDQSVQQLQLSINTYQSQMQDLTEELSVKSNELTMAKDFLAKLKFSKNNTNAEDDATDTNEEAHVLNADVILQQMSDVSNVKAELSAIKEERDAFKEQLLTEREARTAAEESIKDYSSENQNLKIEYSKAHQERVEAKTKLDVLSNYFKDKEMQLQKELGLQEAMRQQSQENVSSVTHRIATYEQQAELNQLQLSTLKTEIENQEKSFRSQLMVQEKKAHENWIAARVAERKLEQIKQDSAILRNKLTLLEQEKKEYMDDKLNAKKLNSSNNGEITTAQKTLQPEDRSGSMDLPTSGSSSLFREPLAADPRLPFLPIDRPLPPPMPPFLHPMQMMPPPPHLMQMSHPVPLMPPHFMGPRRGLPPMDMWMADRPRHSPPFDHPINRERRTPPAYAQQRSPPPYEERLSSPSAISGERRGDESYGRDGYREQTPPSRYSDQPGPPSNTDNIPPHLRRYKLDNGSVNSRKPSPVVKRNFDNSPSV